MTQRWVSSSDGVQLSVRITGPARGPTIVCVHGYPDNSSLWDEVIAELDDRFRMVTYDVRGTGSSGKPTQRAAYRLDQLAADLAAIVDEVTGEGGAGTVHLLGHDWGSIQIWHAITGHWLRGRAASFTSISGPCLDHVAHWMRTQLRPSPRTLRAAINQLLRSTYVAFFQLPVVPELAWRTGMLTRITRQLDPSAAVPQLSDALNGLNLYRANMLPRLQKPGRRHAGVPVQVLAPVDDPFVTVPMQTEISRWVPELHTRTISGRHWVPRTDPARLAGAVTELVEYAEGGAASRGLRRARVNPRPRERFPGHLVLVTGAGSGIGRATAQAFARSGADLVLVDVDAEALARTAEEVRAIGAAAAPYPVDVSDGQAMEELASTVRAEHGVPDIVVNNAGLGLAGSFVDTGVADWQRVIDVNLWGVIHGSRVFGRQLIERGEGGHIVNIASIAAYLPNTVLPAYSTTKSAVLMLSECLRAEFASHRIGVSAICPGVVSTNIAGTARFAGADEPDQHRRRLRAARLFSRRNFDPNRVAGDILRAVEHNKALTPTTVEAKTALALSRLTPGLLRAAARRWPG